MKKRIALVLALALLAAMLCSCGGAKQNEETTTTEPTTTEAPLVWNEELQNKIKTTYVEKFGEYDYDKNPTIEDVHIEKYYGIYNNAVPVIISGFSDYLDVLTCETVDGIEFGYGNTNKILVWKDNAFYTLQEAFNKGFLNHKDLLQIAELHNPEWVQAK